MLLRLKVGEGAIPPAITPLVPFDVEPDAVILAVIKSPKSVPLPALAIVKNSILFEYVDQSGEYPPA